MCPEKFFFPSLHAYFTITRCDQESSVRIVPSFLVLGRNVILKKKRKRGKERNRRERGRERNGMKRGRKLSEWIRVEKRK